MFCYPYNNLKVINLLWICCRLHLHRIRCLGLYQIPSPDQKPWLPLLWHPIRHQKQAKALLRQHRRLFGLPFQVHSWVPHPICSVPVFVSFLNTFRSYNYPLLAFGVRPKGAYRVIPACLPASLMSSYTLLLPFGLVIACKKNLPLLKESYLLLNYRQLRTNT